MKNKNFPFFEVLFLLCGEIAVSLAVCGIYILIDRFNYKVVTGAVLGTVVTLLNFLFLIVSTNRVFDRAKEARGTREMSEEEIEAFVAEHKRQYSNMTQLSFIIRSVTMLAALVVAFILDQFDVIATLVPLLVFRPLLMLAALIKGKVRKDEV